MDFNDLLKREKLDCQKVLVLRHRPKEKELRKVMPWLAAERPAVFNAYQQTQSLQAEKQMQKADYVASFIGHEAGRALFVGLYEARGSKPMTAAMMNRVPEHVELGNYGHGSDTVRPGLLWLDLVLTDLFADCKGNRLPNSSKSVGYLRATVEVSTFCNALRIHDFRIWVARESLRREFGTGSETFLMSCERSGFKRKDREWARRSRCPAELDRALRVADRPAPSGAGPWHAGR